MAGKTDIKALTKARDEAYEAYAQASAKLDEALASGEPAAPEEPEQATA